MCPPTETLSRFQLDESPRLRPIAPGGFPRAGILHGPAENDATCELQPAEEIDAWARHALAANGFGDAAIDARPSSVALHRAARAHRSYLLGSLIGAAFAATAKAGRHALKLYRRRRDAQATREALQRLDDRALRDLGFTRDEIGSIASELSGAAEASRVHALSGWYGSPM
jgi:uncharacterized protein YjiS (DUF1127 family)